MKLQIKRVIKFSTARDYKRQLICSSIRQLRPLEFYYHGGLRSAEPFALGIVLTDKRDNEALLCWQTGGVSDSAQDTGWKLYRMSDMEDIEVLNQYFTGDRPGYEPENLEMAQVICCVSKVIRPVASAAPPPPPAPEAVSAPAVEYQPPPPPARIRPIVRVISHNQLMDRFREAHPQPIPELDAMLWQEPLAAPFSENPPESRPPAVVERAQETSESKIWPDTPVSGLPHSN